MSREGNGPLAALMSRSGYNWHMLNTRELAMVIWAGALFVLCCAYRPTRQMLGPVARSVARPKILTIVALVAAYIFGVVYVASRLGLWDLDLLGPTLVWSVPALLGVGFSALEATKQEEYFKYAVRGLLSGAVLLEFLVNFETFPLWWELFQLPVVTLVAVMVVVAGGSPEHAPARSLMQALLGLAGLGLLCAAVVSLVGNWGKYDVGDFLRSFGVGLWLPLSTLPLVYLVSVVMLRGAARSRIDSMSGERLSWSRRLGLFLGAGISRHRLRRMNHADYRRMAGSASFREAFSAARMAGRQPAHT